ncbi:hypothetical protein [Saccharomonospora saliphila]|uniref:hypothetical protein n=1 Tax=Saccharomonospora saliphila TaxID=369829 RepID=UPI000360E740|nr:hypothetical protein [Saccharomonospora saliphila]
MSLEELRHGLAETLGGLAEARAHHARARRLLEDYRRVVVDAQAQAQPWLPRELDLAVERLDADQARIDGADDLIHRYQSRL